MRATILQITADVVLGSAMLLALPSAAPAQDSLQAPTYSRTRTGAEDWHARGGGYVHGQGDFGYGYGYFQPYISPVVAGSWYARPYPYHFDYFRGRWDGPRSGIASDCPCAESAAGVETVGEAAAVAP